ncbi:RsiV family protein [Neobacillus sp. DY30]|uniref:RsiV family protein n=1 Tax=Neobacillus sp. DY30 TaxID=3047871 RepID=UPI0032E4D8D8
MDKNIERLKSKYMDIEIPSDLDDVVNRALNSSRKKNRTAIKILPILFKNQNYIETISENIKDQMKQQMKEDKTKVYWILDAGVENPIDPFENITANHNFYINQDNKLVISFDKYEVAPGYMGVVEFIIPTDLLSDDLLGSEYIK